MTTVKVPNGKTVTIAGYKGDVPVGKVFHAWNTKADGTGITYKVGKKVAMVESLRLYPVFIDAAESVEDFEESSEEDLDE